jgi:Phage tail assembly chaperone
MAILSRDIILSQKLTQEVVAVPEWGGEVIVRELMGDEADIFEARAFASGIGNTANGNQAKKVEEAARHFRARLVAASCIDEAGNRLFNDEDISTLGKLSRSALDRVAAVAMRLSGYSTDTKKNSPAEEGSSTDSPSS